jgi:4'-phosphopantetheinyl transferase
MQDLQAAFASSNIRSDLRAGRRDAVLLLSADDWASHEAEAMDMLDAEERARVERRRRPEDRRTLAVAYAFHRLLLAEILGCAPAQVPLYRDALGCPRLRECGDVSTSLSHADGGIALAVSPRGPVGIDLEPAARTRAMPDIAHAVLHPDDGLPIDPGDTDGDEWARAVLALWVRKEALLKAAGIGMERAMTEFAAPERKTMAAPAGTAQLMVRMLDAGPGWVAALAATPGEEPLLARLPAFAR